MRALMLLLLMLGKPFNAMAQVDEVDCEKSIKHYPSFAETKAAALKAMGASFERKISDRSICKYHAVKAMFAPHEEVIGISAIDFSRNLEFVHVLPKWTEAFNSVVYTSGDFSFTVHSNPDGRGTSLIVPIFNGKAQVEYRGSSGSAISFIDSRAGQSLVIAPSNSQGVEIYIKTQPSGASINFNGKKYHANSDTTSVRSPGEINVELSKSGYKTKRLFKAMTAGQSWLIDETLEKE